MYFFLSNFLKHPNFRELSEIDIFSHGAKYKYDLFEQRYNYTRQKLCKIPQFSRIPQKPNFNETKFKNFSFGLYFLSNLVLKNIKRPNICTFHDKTTYNLRRTLNNNDIFMKAATNLWKGEFMEFDSFEKHKSYDLLPLYDLLDFNIHHPIFPPSTFILATFPDYIDHICKFKSVTKTNSIRLYYNLLERYNCNKFTDLQKKDEKAFLEYATCLILLTHLYTNLVVYQKDLLQIDLLSDLRSVLNMNTNLNKISKIDTKQALSHDVILHFGLAKMTREFFAQENKIKELFQSKHLRKLQIFNRKSREFAMERLYEIPFYISEKKFEKNLEKFSDFDANCNFDQEKTQNLASLLSLEDETTIYNVKNDCALLFDMNKWYNLNNIQFKILGAVSHGSRKYEEDFHMPPFGPTQVFGSEEIDQKWFKHYILTDKIDADRNWRTKHYLRQSHHLTHYFIVAVRPFKENTEKRLADFEPVDSSEMPSIQFD